jgi:REP element-mobilizing transposase RayT
MSVKKFLQSKVDSRGCNANVRRFKMATRQASARRLRQQTGRLPFKQWGGARPGAGRKPKGEKAGVSHARRALLAARFPVHATVRLSRGLPPLRRRAEYATLRAAFAAGCDRFGFRLVHYAVLNDHLHLIVEAKDREALARGIKGLLVRVAKALNKLWSRRGRVFADRYHDRILESPREVRNALVYVMNNERKHAARNRVLARETKVIDVFTSAPWFDGWRETITLRGLEGVVRPVAPSRTWLLSVGWRRHGLLSAADAAAAAAGDKRC